METQHSFKLRHGAIHFQGKDLQEIGWRDVKVADVLKAAESGAGQVGMAFAIVSAVTGIPKATLRGMDGEDWKRLSQELEKNQAPREDDEAPKYRRPLAGDYEILDGPQSDYRKSVLFAEALTGLAFEDLVEMDAHRFNALQKELAGFFGQAGPESGT